MPEQFLYERVKIGFEMGVAKPAIPENIIQNLHPKYDLRPYQIDAFSHFIHCYKNDFPGKTNPLHLLFNMATGSGKTLIMAGLMLYLYEQGYRNFLFFVNSTNIIQKTKDNFLNPTSIKYLFNRQIHIGTRRVQVTPVENFEAVNPNDMNICFTTIQKLHSDLTTEKENALTFEDFRKHKVVLIADEAHHMNVKTKSEIEMFESWENTVQRIFEQNRDNFLLEFTATHDYETPAMVSKYRNKVIIRYDLLQFRNDKYSKDVILVYSDFDLDQRIIQALLLSQYKWEVAAKHKINLKPVLLFKAQRTIEQSVQNKASFHRLIDRLAVKDIENIRSKTDIPLMLRAFEFFQQEGITDAQLVERIKREFHPDFCLSVNDESEKENYQILVNTLEDKNNRIRAIFAVQKLNEGWDVLNLFDIVRCYETRDSGKNKIGTTTVSEAQLVGRGARYFPFATSQTDDRFRRKYDENIKHELRVLEELHYHSINDNRYISEIRRALVEQGMMDEREVTRQLKLKDSFKKSDFYNFGIIWLNDKRPKQYGYVRSFADLGVKKRNYVHFIATGHGGTEVALVNSKKGGTVKEETRRDVAIPEIERNIVQAAIARHPFFTFATLKRYFPHLTTMQDFISSKEYLGGLGITFQGNLYRLEENRSEKLTAVIGLLSQIETEINANVSDYEGTTKFRHNLVKEVFKNKVLKFDTKNPRGELDAQFEHFVSDKEWYAFNTLFGTSEEKAFVRMLDRLTQKMKERFNQIYLLRNEGHFAIYNFSNGQAFEPDFVLFLREKDGKVLTYQLFIEPKGKHLKGYDEWKKTFLEEIKTRFKAEILKFDSGQYRLVGVPFYNNEDENEFSTSLWEAIS